MNKSTRILIFVMTAVIGISIAFYFNQSESDNMTNWKEQIENKPGIIIDVRTPAEYRKGHLAVADLQYDFNSGEFEEKVDELDKDRTYYLYCRSGNRSGKAAEMMKTRGFEDVHNIGGYNDLVSAGFETK
ncbi:MAG: rhodanese-like domain-containing protein [Bacteroidetes bacterium]|jgi:phage shock protein E|nr:rhodanese-like domain-containing protein [Bacteroidota bacterium]